MRKIMLASVAALALGFAAIPARADLTPYQFMGMVIFVKTECQHYTLDPALTKGFADSLGIDATKMTLAEWDLVDQAVKTMHGMRNAACAAAWKGFGPDGTHLPGMISAK